MTPEERREYDAARRPRKGWVLRPCGTYAAAMRHIREGAPLCEQCAAALRGYRAALTRASRARKKEVKVGPNEDDPGGGL